MNVLLEDLGREKVTRWVRVEDLDDILAEAEKHLASLSVELGRTSNLEGHLLAGGRQVGRYRIVHRLPATHEALPVSIDRWGRDHKSTLLYVESRCVDEGGTVDFRQMRCHWSRHPHYRTGGHADRDGAGYGTRLGDDTTLEHHDDWDCVHDFVWHGFVVLQGDNLQPRFKMTEAGLAVAAELRAERARAASV